MLEIAGPQIEQQPFATAALPTASFDLLKWFPTLIAIGQAVITGTGSFSTATPLGKRWVKIQGCPFTEGAPP